MDKLKPIPGLGSGFYEVDVPAGTPGLENQSSDRVSVPLAAKKVWEKMAAPAVVVDSFVLVLPYPISANRYWTTYNIGGKNQPARMIQGPTPEAKAFKQECQWIAKACGLQAPLTTRVMLSFMLFPKRPKDAERRIRKNASAWDDDVRCIDLDNALKTTIDALRGVVYEDDDQVWKIVAERAEPDGDARIVAIVEALAPRVALL